MLFHKKRRDMTVEKFRHAYLHDYSKLLKTSKIPNLVRILSCLSRESLYAAGGAPPFDAVTHLSANSYLELKQMIGSPELQAFLDPEHGGLSEWWGVVSLAVRSEWVLGEARPSPAS